MGGVDSKLTEFLIEGRENEALELYHSNESYKDQVSPNTRLSKSPYGDTPLLCAARYGMKSLLDELLVRGGDPCVANRKNETAFHLVCKFSQSITSSRRSKLRTKMLTRLLEHVGCGHQTVAAAAHPNKSTRKDGKSPYDISLSAQDESLNTPLHLACASGLLECVELLVAYNAPLFMTNVARQTPCDVAASAKHVVIAKLLESKMVFAKSQGAHRSSSYSCSRRGETLMDTDHLIALKYQLVFSVCHQLNISEFAAEALLMCYGWSEDLVIVAFNHDQTDACIKAGISIDDTMMPLDTPSYHSSRYIFCDVCTEELCDDGVRLKCGHNFCDDCMRGYLQVRIQDGGGHNIQCPGGKCSRPIPPVVVERLVSQELMNKYTTFDIRTFVDTNCTTQWCPHVECEGVIHLPPSIVASGNRQAEGAITGNTGINVECANGHMFCWSCHDEPHEPCDCDVWLRWQEECSNMTGSGDHKLTLQGQAGEAAANIKWILKNSKPCPKCRSPIQKNEGCNHIYCSKCRHDFCWVCLDKWSLHNYKTGGYFMCNRFKQIEKNDTKLQTIQQARECELKEQAKQQLEIQKKKFEEHHKRFSNHLQSAELERDLLKASKEKTAHLITMAAVADRRVNDALVRSHTMPSSQDSSQLVQSITLPRSTKVEPKMITENFLAEVIRVLIYARHILAISYVIGYFILDKEEAMNHEHMQSFLEEQVEELSQSVTRPHLNAPKSSLIKMAKNLDSTLAAYKSKMNKTHRKLVSLDTVSKRHFSMIV